MNEQLSKNEVEMLFKFVKSKYVHYIDVQHEIVDHLASSIEEMKAKNPSVSFETALRQVYSNFPITGFASLVAEKQTSLSRYWTKRFWGYMLSYMRLPKIIIAGLLVYIFQLILSNGLSITPSQLYIVLVIAAFCSVGYRYKYGFEFNKDFRDKYLVTSTYLAFYAGIFSMNFYFPLNMALVSAPETVVFDPVQSWLFAIYIVVCVLWIHGSTFIFPKMLKQELEEKYSHLNIKIA